MKDRDDLAKLRNWLSGAKRVWINVYYEDGACHYTPEDAAKKATCKAIRIAVPFVELSKECEEVLK